MSGDDRRIQIGGNARVTGSQIAGGDQVSQTQHLGSGEPPPQDIAEALDRIGRLLDQHAAELYEPERARRDLGDILEETAEPHPDRDRLSHALTRLTGRVAGVAALAEAVHQLAGLLGLE